MSQIAVSRDSGVEQEHPGRLGGGEADVDRIEGAPQNQSVGMGDRMAPITALKVMAPASAVGPNGSPSRSSFGTPFSTPVRACRVAATVTMAGSVPTDASGVMVTSCGFPGVARIWQLRHCWS